MLTILGYILLVIVAGFIYTVIKGILSVFSQKHKK